MESLANVERIEKRISALQETIQEANGELPKLSAQLIEARSLYAAEVAKAQEIRWAELKTELAQHCHELDRLESGGRTQSDGNLSGVPHGPAFRAIGGNFARLFGRHQES
jgi:hypothetical protein